jgi:hypothetical protein
MRHSGEQKLSAGIKLVFKEAAEECSRRGSVEAVVMVENSNSHLVIYLRRKTFKNITLVHCFP